ncbi:MAG: STAS domain-containing protein [Gammaproteobacteria bacterium]
MHNFTLNVLSEREDQVVIELAGPLNAATGSSLRQALLERLEQGCHKLFLDCASLDYIDSSGLSCLLDVVRESVRCGHDKCVALYALKPDTLSLLHISGLLHFMQVLEDLPADLLQQEEKI